MIEGIPVQGTQQLTTNTTGTILAAPGENSRYYIRAIIISIGAFAATATLTVGDESITLVGEMLLKDGNGNGFAIYFPGDGYKMTANKALTMTIGTAAATARVTVVGIQRTDPS